MANGIVTNVSNNPVELPNGAMIQPGETIEGFDEATLKDNLFLNAGWLVAGKDAKALQAKLDSSETDVALLEAKVEELQDALQKETLRANEAQAKADAADPSKVAELEKAVSTQSARADKAETELAALKKK